MSAYDRWLDVDDDDEWICEDCELCPCECGLEPREPEWDDDGDCYDY